MHTQSQQALENAEARWPAMIALMAVGGLYEALPQALTIGPRGLLLSLVVVLLIPTWMFRRHGYDKWNRILGLTIAGVVTVFMIASLILLVQALPTGRERGTRLLISAASLWMTNILVFALWYWHLDAGGPHQRDMRVGHTDGAFFFPQMAMTPEARQEAGENEWSPNFIDYLFLAFNFSTALSPADTAVLSRWAKLLAMLQAIISLTVIALLAARAVNILA